jgi:hypothetical protein
LKPKDPVNRHFTGVGKIHGFGNHLKSGHSNPRGHPYFALGLRYQQLILVSPRERSER